MKQYDVKITHKALADMEAIYDFLADGLQSAEAAMKQYDRIASAIESLKTLPNRCSRLRSEPEHALGMRQLLVGRYSVIYVVEEPTVVVLRVLYSASDLHTRLQEGN